MAAKLWNWRLWAGFGLSMGALAGYVFWVNETRAVFWPALLLFAVAAVLLFSGGKRRSREPELYGGRAFPQAKNAPRIGQRAPEFSLLDASGKNFTLAQLLSTPLANSGSATHSPKGVLVLFYRGYW